MNFHVVTLFPETIEAYTNASILGRAQKEKRFSVKTYQLRDSSDNKWGKVDERPYGGGPGMVLRAEPVVKAVEKITKKKPEAKIIIFGAGGKPFTNLLARQWTKKYSDIILVAGRYEGLDTRAKKILKAEEISVGPYILTGGEIPAMVIIDAMARQLPGVLGRLDSIEEGRIASHDVYTRPEILKHNGKNYRVPKVLLSGNHADMDAWKGKKRSGLHT